MKKNAPNANCPFASSEKVDDDKQFTLKEIIVDIHKEVKAHNGRIRKLENWRSYSVGIISAVVMLVGAWLKYG